MDALKALASSDTPDSERGPAIPDVDGDYGRGHKRGRDEGRRGHDDSRSSRRRSRSRSRSPPRRRTSRTRSRSPKRSRDGSSSPPRRRRRRKPGGLWDQAPPGFSAGGAPTGFSSAPPPGAPVAGGGPGMAAHVPPGMMMGMRPGGMPGMMGHPGGLLAQAQQSTQDRQAKRLYVGNLPRGITSMEMSAFFNAAMNQSEAVPGVNEPVVNVTVNNDKNFAFIELASPECATAALAMDGIALNGCSLRLRRPKDFVAPPGSAPPPQKVESDCKIFVGGIPFGILDDQVRELLAAFGPLKLFNIVRDPITNKSKGFGFCEFEDHSVTDKAIEALNGMELQDKKMVVQRANVGRKAPGTGANAPLPSFVAPSTPCAQNFLNLGLPAAMLLQQLPTLVGPGGPQTSKVLQLLNLLADADLVKGDYVTEVEEDVRLECEKIGSVESTHIPRPAAQEANPDGFEQSKLNIQSVPCMGRVFVKFATVEDSMKAQMALGGRKFNCRTVITSFYDEEKYDAKDFE
eukprot:TRINITY_DN3961_c0_g1_i4.p1 TRINITY_DN3961_c0_g1~~TRINITY_DN3961_c0_g1_i4.p1  ORF type:complete len:546 (-),score=87.76 TRINITY_DN3961_c0_g1_i4:238-1785(-)